MKKIKLPGAVDTLFAMSACLISAGLGLWLGLAAGLIGAGAFCFMACWLVDQDPKGGDRK